MLGISNDGDTPQIWNDFPQYIEALRVQLGCHKRKASHVATRPGQTFSEPGHNRIPAKHVNRG